MLIKEKDNWKQVQSRYPMCQKFHDLDACYSYTKMEAGDRKNFLMKHKLCFGCYEPRSKDYSGRNCLGRRVCCVCKENHLTGLHGYKPKSKESVVGGSQSSEEKSTVSGRKITLRMTWQTKIIIYPLTYFPPPPKIKGVRYLFFEIWARKGIMKKLPRSRGLVERGGGGGGGNS